MVYGNIFWGRNSAIFIFVSLFIWGFSYLKAFSHFRIDPIFVFQMDGWMTCCDFMPFLRYFSQYAVWMIMKGSVQFNSVHG